MPDARDHAARRALLVVDVQEAFVKRTLYEKDRFLSTIREAVSRFRAAGETIVFVRHESAMSDKGTPGWQLVPNLGCRAEDPIVDKQHGNAFEGTGLAELLDSQSVGRVVVCGLVSHGCVRLTCLGAKALGFHVDLLALGHSNWASDAAAKIEATEGELAKAGIPTVAIGRIPTE